MFLSVLAAISISQTPLGAWKNCLQRTSEEYAQKTNETPNSIYLASIGKCKPYEDRVREYEHDALVEIEGTYDDLAMLMQAYKDMAKDWIFSLILDQRSRSSIK